MDNLGIKVVFLNSWAHRQATELHTFLQSTGADVICLTEVTDTSEYELTRVGHNLAYTGNEAAAHMDGIEQLKHQFCGDYTITYRTPERRPWDCIKTGVKFSNVGFGVALMVQDGVDIVSDGFVYITFEDIDKALRPRILQWVVFEKHNQRYLVAHFHGLWIRENTKGDHAARDHQSLTIRAALKRLQAEFEVEKILLGGDFNLDINTTALKLLEEGTGSRDVPYKNQIKRYSISNTRTPLYRHFHDETVSRYADYVLTSPAVLVHSFVAATDILASDHAPLIITCS